MKLAPLNLLLFAGLVLPACNTLTGHLAEAEDRLRQTLELPPAPGSAQPASLHSPAVPMQTWPPAGAQAGGYGYGQAPRSGYGNNGMPNYGSTLGTHTPTYPQVGSAATAIRPDAYRPSYAELASTFSPAPGAATGPSILPPELVRGLHEEAQQRWSSARSYYVNAARGRPGSMELMLAQARTYHAERKPWEAATLLESRGPGQAPPEMLNATGDAILAAGSASMSMSYYRQALASRPHDLGLTIDYAVAAHLSHRHAEVVGALQSAPVEQLPPPVRLMLGRSSLLSGRPEIAVVALQSYLHTASQDLGAWTDLARAQFLRGQEDVALDILEPLVELDPRAIETRVLLGHVHARAGRIEQARAEYEQAIALGASPVSLQAALAAVGASR